MSADVAVSDASPLIALNQIGHLELLRNLFDRVIVPQAVMHEVTPSVGALPIWVHRQQAPAPPDPARRLDVGEREAIALAVHLGADFVVMDDRPGRSVVERLGLDVIGTLGLLVRARRRGLIRSVRPMMDQLVSNGLYVSVHLYREILEAVGETDACAPCPGSLWRQVSREGHSKIHHRRDRSCGTATAFRVLRPS